MGSIKVKHVWHDEAGNYSLPDHLTEPLPFKNKKTGEIQYISWWDLYIDRQREVLTKAILYGIGETHQKFHVDDWEAIPDTTALRLLHGPKKVK